MPDGWIKKGITDAGCIMRHRSGGKSPTVILLEARPLKIGGVILRYALTPAV